MNTYGVHTGAQTDLTPVQGNTVCRRDFMGLRFLRVSWFSASLLSFCVFSMTEISFHRGINYGRDHIAPAGEFSTGWAILQGIGIFPELEILSARNAGPGILKMCLRGKLRKGSIRISQFPSKRKSR
jgi:hypothetical protein